MKNNFYLCETGWKIYDAMVLVMNNDAPFNPLLQELKTAYDNHRRQCDACTKPREDKNVNKND